MDRRIASFLLMAFAVSWAIAGAGHLAGVGSAGHLAYPLLGALFMLGPAIAAIVQQRVLDKAPWAGLGLRIKGTRWGVMALTAVAGMAIVPVFFLVVWTAGDLLGVAAFGEVSVSGARFARAMDDMLLAAGQQGASAQLEFLRDLPGGVLMLIFLLTGLVAAFTVNLPFMLGEELGWRGYLWQRLRHWDRPRRVLFTGLAWGLWHAPLIAMGHNYPGRPGAGIAMMVLFCLSAAWLFDLTRARSGSLWSSCVLHGLINGTAGAAAIFTWNGHVLIGTIAGAAGCLALLVVALLFHLATRHVAEAHSAAG
jgi:membrane protease YdiL (CAAX protease family)